jgi:methionyl-tRNA formyltransferase
VKLVYLGTPQMAVPPLEGLVAAGHDVVLAVTRPDARRGRRSTPSPSPVKAAAQALGIEVTHDVDDVVTIARQRNAELGVVVAFGRIIKPHVLDALPMVNLHFSLLPRWRGAAPVERALLAGDETTGVCLMQVDEGLDTGAVYARVEVPITPEVTAAQLRSELVAAGTDLLISELASGLGTPVPQNGHPTYADKIGPDDLRIDWTRAPAEIHRLVRVGGAWTTFRGARLKILEASIDDGLLEPVLVQPESKAPMRFVDWSNGARPAPGEWFE